MSETAVFAGGTTTERTARAWKRHVYFWDTDLQWLYHGDGATLGGVPVPKGDFDAITDVDSTALPDVDATALPSNGTIGGLTISDPPTQLEVQALRDECENLRDALAASNTAINHNRDRLADTLAAVNLELARLRSAKVIKT